MLSYEQTLRLFEKEAHPFRENGYDVLPVFACWDLFYEGNEDVLPGGMEFADTRGRVSLRPGHPWLQDLWEHSNGFAARNTARISGRPDITIM